MEQRHAPLSLAPSEAEADAMRDEIIRLFKSLRRPTQLRFLAYVTWEADDGRPETDPRNNDPEWQEFERRRMSG